MAQSHEDVQCLAAIFRPTGVLRHQFCLGKSACLSRKFRSRSDGSGLVHGGTWFSSCKQRLAGPAASEVQDHRIYVQQLRLAARRMEVDCLCLSQTLNTDMNACGAIRSPEPSARGCHSLMPCLSAILLDECSPPELAGMTAILHLAHELNLIWREQAPNSRLTW